MLKQQTLKPQDVAVALRLAESPDASYAALGSDLEMSSSTAHESVERLQLAGLLRPESRQVNRHSLMEFLEHGVRYTFPAKLGATVRGVPTAYSAAPLAGEFVSFDNVVWPNAKGSAIGQSLTPLYEKAPELVAKCPSTYELLTLVDAIRIGRVRERAAAVSKIKERLGLAA
jgi:DNA-binding Lrp family transcriptional regulator